MDWVFDYVTPDELPEIIAGTGAMLARRRTYEAGKRDAGKTSGEAYGGAWSGPQFVLTHEPPDDPGDPAVTFLAGDIEAAVGTVLKAAAPRSIWSNWSVGGGRADPPALAPGFVTASAS
jgi:hypothetical protein